MAKRKTKPKGKQPVDSPNDVHSVNKAGASVDGIETTDHPIDGRSVNDAGAGDVTPASSSSTEPNQDEPPVTRERTWAIAANQWTREGRRQMADAFREVVRLECVAKGKSRKDAKEYSWDATMAAFPPEGKPASAPEPAPKPAPEPTEPKPEPTPEPAPASEGQLQGLDSIPTSWPTLPANAAQQAELGWVQSNRLTIIEHMSSGAVRVHLDRAHEPAPSRAALGWLETSIRSYAKYIEVAARALRDEADEQDEHRRERVALDEIEALLIEMQA